MTLLSTSWYWYPHLKLITPTEKELLQKEFISYQLLTDTDIHCGIWEEAKVAEDEDAYYRIGILWNYLFEVQKVDAIELKFHRLIQIAKVALIIPYSNAADESAFSMVR